MATVPRHVTLHFVRWDNLKLISSIDNLSAHKEAIIIVYCVEGWSGEGTRYFMMDEPKTNLFSINFVCIIVFKKKNAEQRTKSKLKPAAKVEYSHCLYVNIDQVMGWGRHSQLHGNHVRK